MPGTTKAKRSPEWNAAYEQALQSARPESEKEFIRLLARPIAAGDTRGILGRVNAFRTLVAETPLVELRGLESKLSNDRRGLGRLYELELSTGFRNKLLGDVRKRIRKDDAGLSDKSRGIANRRNAAGVRRQDPAVGPAASPPTPPASNPWHEIGPFGVNYPLEDKSDRLVIPIDGSFLSKKDAQNAIVDPVARAIKRIQPDATLEALYAPASDGGFQLTLRVSGAAPIEVYAAISDVQGQYRHELSKIRVSEKEQADREAMRAWARAFADLGNLINIIPFTEFTEEGFEPTSDPSSAITLIKGVKGIKNLKGQGKIKRRTYKPWVAHAGHLKKLKQLFHGGVDRGAWKRAINKLSPADKAILRELQEAEREVLKLIKADRRAEAYKIVKKWRKKARGLYNKVRDNYWQDADVRRQWADVGADMNKPAPKIGVARIEEGQRFREVQTVTLEHKTRLHDNPFLAVFPDNVAMSLSYENSVMLEAMRRIEKGRSVVWSSGIIERMVRSIEAGLE